MGQTALSDQNCHNPLDLWGRTLLNQPDFQCTGGPSPMDDQNKNLILATALSFLVILVWFVLFPPPDAPPSDPNAPAAVSSTTAGAVTAPIAATAPEVVTTAPAVDDATKALENAPRIAIETDSVRGSLSLMGGRIDD